MGLVRCKECGQSVSSKAKACPQCGAPVPKLGCLSIMLIGFLACVLICVGAPLLTDLSESYRRRSFQPQSVPKKQDSSTAQVRAQPDDEAERENESPIEIVIFNELQKTYPALRGDLLRWRDAFAGMYHIAVPDDFWRILSKDDRVQFAKELDLLFESHNWVIETGRYEGQGNVRTDTGHHRAEFLTDTSSAKPRMSIFGRLKARYPELRGDRLFWRDYSGKLCVAVPDPFWNTLSATDKRQLAKDIDDYFKTQSWIVTTGRYMGRGKMMLDVHHSRRELINADNE